MPSPRGPVSEAIRAALLDGCSPVSVPLDIADPLGDDDLHVALTICYELHLQGIRGVDERREWDPQLLTVRRSLEDMFEASLRLTCGSVTAPTGSGTLSRRLVALSERGDGALSTYLARQATVEQFREFVTHRSIYTLKEADPHSFLIPRLSGGSKAALVEIQADEYGGGVPDRMHAALFASTMRALDLDPAYGAYLDSVPGVTLATVNLVLMFGLHRRLRGAAAGHLALFELSSAIPNRRYGDGLRRLGFDDEATHYYDEHVEADSVHDMVAAYDLVGALVAQEPGLGGEILFGALALELLEERLSSHLLDRWGSGRSSLMGASLATAG